MRILGLIPARMGSTRFPGKPLAPIAGVAMIQRVYEASAKCADLTELYVATCDQEIASFVQRFGGNAIMTGTQHQRASDRCAEALSLLESNLETSYDIVVMIQGDEPLINAEMISAAIQPIKNDASINVVNLISRITSSKELCDTNCIKVVFSKDLDAIYFSRLPIPFSLASRELIRYKQVCIIPFRRDYLETYQSLKASLLEQEESIDMLRILEHGGKVKLVPTNIITHAVDCPDDIKNIEALLPTDRRT